MRHWILGLAVLPLCIAAETGFAPLFDGATLNGWEVRPRESASGRWEVAGSELTVRGRPGNLATTSEYGDFDLRLEWRIGPLGNSGVFYRVSQDGNPAATAVECQIADPARQASMENADRRPGAAYGLYAPTADASRPPGEWNALRIVVQGTRAEHWLNGRKVVEFDFASEEFARRAQASNRKEGFGRALKGRIELQDHNSAVWFRNIRIRRLD